MFSSVVAVAREYTRAVVILYRMTDGRVESNVGTYIHLDDVGHILSASHIFKMGSEDPISTISVIFDGQYFNAEYVADDVRNDIILLRIKDYKRGSIKVFPKFLRGSNGELHQGTPLVRLGYPRGKPHSDIAVTWDELGNQFKIEGTPTVNSFYNEGIVMRYVDRENDARLVELSSPALLGQSGGPLLTAEGFVAGVQSRNTVLEFPQRPPRETGLATSHIHVAKLLENTGMQISWR